VELIDEQLRSLPCVDGYFIVEPGKRFFVRYRVQKQADSATDLGIKVTVDGQLLESVQPVRSSEEETIILAGFPIWQMGHCAYRAFEFAWSRRKAATSTAGGTFPSASIGSVLVEAFPTTYSSAEPKYSSVSSVSQVRAAPPQEDKKFFETASVSAAPGAVIARVSKPASMVIQWQCSTASSRRMIYYDTALNLELRGVLNREQHAHLLPAEQVDDRKTPSNSRKRTAATPVSETVEIMTIDLLDDQETKVTVEKRPRKIHDLVE
jgi:hypothetical protein